MDFVRVGGGSYQRATASDQRASWAAYALELAAARGQDPPGEEEVLPKTPMLAAACRRLAELLTIVRGLQPRGPPLPHARDWPQLAGSAAGRAELRTALLETADALGCQLPDSQPPDQPPGSQPLGLLAAEQEVLSLAERIAWLCAWLETELKLDTQ